MCDGLLADEPIELFNGRDFDGWKFDVITSRVEHGEIWRVEDGMIACVGRPLSVMRTAAEFESYELALEWRWPDGGRPGNTGVLVHASTPRERSVWPKSIEVQLAHGRAGDFWLMGETLEVEGREAIGRRIPKNGENPEREPGEWNKLTVRCEGDTITVTINGVVVNEGRKSSASRGAICLQSEGAAVHFRNLKLTPLSTPESTEPESPAPDADNE
jgi:hypothetical protein